VSLGLELEVNLTVGLPHDVPLDVPQGKLSFAAFMFDLTPRLIDNNVRLILTVVNMLLR
jgi:hypothetical protein